MTAAADLNVIGEPGVDLAEPQGTVYDIAGMAVAGFVVRTKLLTGAAVRVTLGESEGVGGRVTARPDETIFDASTSAYLTFTDVGYDASALTYDVKGLSRFEEVSVDVTIPRKSPPRGRMRARRASATRLEVRGVTATEGIVLEQIVAGGIDIVLEPRRTVVHVQSIVLGSVEIATPTGDIELRDVALENVVVQVPLDGKTRTEIGELRIAGVAGPVPSGSVALRDVVLADVAADVGGAISVAAGAAEALTVTWRRPSTIAEIKHRDKGDVGSPVDLSFLDGLEGHIHSDVLTHVRIPLIPDWRAEHQVRLDVKNGAIEYERLEHGMSRLPDAVLDFELRDGALCLDKDIPFVPFDRRTLLSWPLDEQEQQLAASGWIKLSRLVEPRIEAQRKTTKTDEGGRFLEEVRIRDIDVRVSLAAHDGLALPNGGTLRLGAPRHPGSQGPVGATNPEGVDEPARAIDYAHLQGEMIMRPDDRNPVGSLMLEARGVRGGLRDARAGERRISLGDLTFERVSAETRTRDFTVQQLHGQGKRLRLRGLEVKPS